MLALPSVAKLYGYMIQHLKKCEKNTQSCRAVMLKKRPDVHKESIFYTVTTTDSPKCVTRPALLHVVSLIILFD